MGSLLNHRILITGAARGLGEAFTRACLAQGAQVCISDVDEARGLMLLEELKFLYPGKCHFVQMNVSQSGSVAQGVLQAAQTMGGIDGVVNNAAITHSGGKWMHELTEDMWDQVMAVNVKGTWLVTTAAHPYLKASHYGRVVNLSSDTAMWGAPKLLAYVASKSAINGMTHSMARELGADHITVNAIAPGLVVGESTQYVPQARHDDYLKGRAIPREQLPADVTQAVVFLLSKEAGFITGQILPVNGGFVMN